MAARKKPEYDRKELEHFHQMDKEEIAALRANCDRMGQLVQEARRDKEAADLARINVERQYGQQQELLDSTKRMVEVQATDLRIERERIAEAKGYKERVTQQDYRIEQLRTLAATMMGFIRAHHTEELVIRETLYDGTVKETRRDTWPLKDDYHGVCGS